MYVNVKQIVQASSLHQHYTYGGYVEWEKGYKVELGGFKGGRGVEGVMTKGCITRRHVRTVGMWYMVIYRDRIKDRE